jgi:cation transport ATPase
MCLTNYAFFDKTGTLTKGEHLEVNMAIIDGKIYKINLSVAR